MKSPVLFIIFKREETTCLVFQRIREARPPKLYIAADGPRTNHPEEFEKCKKTRSIVENIDWPCEVHRLYREHNMGCGPGVSSAISWFFQNEEQGIIIEDDILPHIDFFTYCDEMLERYKDDNRIQLITGRNAFHDGYNATYTYYLSNLFHIWGWATWRRVWNTYNYDTSLIPFSDFKSKLSERSLSSNTRRFWKNIFIMMQSHPIDTWDYQLYFNEILYERYSIVPYVNMIENIGFNSEDAAHTKGINNRESNHKAMSPYPLKHPQELLFDTKADSLFAKNFGFEQRSSLELFLIRFARKYLLFKRK